MSEYTILTDSACDLSGAVQRAWGIKSAPLSFHFEDDTIEHLDGSMASGEFYSAMRNGRVSRTSGVNVAAFTELFETELKAGRDILYIGFSTGLSSTYSTAFTTAEELRSKYPERKIFTVDSLCASAGTALLIWLTLKKKKAGATVEEAARYAEETKLHICHWYTVDDLVYLKRGGRIPGSVAVVGNLLGVKPVMHMDDEGHLKLKFPARGRKNAISSLAKKLKETALKVENCLYFISHSDCLDDAKRLEAQLAEITGNKAALITDVGPVIGSHCGPGTLALFFVGEAR